MVIFISFDMSMYFNYIYWLPSISCTCFNVLCHGAAFIKHCYCESIMSNSITLWSNQAFKVVMMSRGAPGARPPLKLKKIWFFGVKSWFFTRNTPKISHFPPLGAFFMCTPPNLKSWIHPWWGPFFDINTMLIIWLINWLIECFTQIVRLLCIHVYGLTCLSVWDCSINSPLRISWKSSS